MDPWDRLESKLDRIDQQLGEARVQLGRLEGRTEDLPTKGDVTRMIVTAVMVMLAIIGAVAGAAYTLGGE